MARAATGCDSGGGRQRERKHRGAVLASLAVAHDDLAARELAVEGAQALRQAEAGAIHQRRHRPPLAIELTEDGLHLITHEDHR